MSPDLAVLPRWQQLWLVEWLRRREGARPATDPPSDLARWREAGGLPARLLARAGHHLGAAGGHLASVLLRLRWLLAVLLLLVGAAAAAGSWALLGDASRAVNVLWLWLALLAPSLGMLGLWLLSLRGAAPAWAGELLVRALSRLPALWPDADAGVALHDLLRGAAGWRWWLGALSHGLWLAALGGALLGLLLALALRRYDFVWETTILPAAVFQTAVQLLGWLPAQFGFAQPDTAMIAASGEAPVAAARRAWASWLVGALLVYGLLPRLLALLLCLWRARRAAAALQLPLALPYYRELAERLAPPSVRLGVRDADHGPAERLQLRHAAHGDGVAWLGLELATLPGLDVPPGCASLGNIESPAQQQAIVAQLAQRPSAKLLVVVDGTQTPDRALLRQLVELAAGCAALAVWLSGRDRDGRHAVWRAALAGLGLAPARMLDDGAAAARWLTAAPPP